MAGTVVITEETYDSIKKVKFAWTSSAGGAADATTTNLFTGKILALYQVPAGGGVQPTNSYNAAVNDSDGVDVLNALGNSLSNAATTIKVEKDGLSVITHSALTLAVTAAGNAKQGTTIVYIG